MKYLVIYGEPVGTQEEAERLVEDLVENYFLDPEKINILVIEEFETGNLVH